MARKYFHVSNALMASGAAGFARTVAPGEALDVWALSDIVEQPFTGAPALASDPQNYRFVNGFVGVGDLPCRQAFRADMAGRPLPLARDWPLARLRLPAMSRRVDFSEFWYRPTHLSAWAATILEADAARFASFRLTTCGGVRLFVNGEEAARFEPFTRNREASETVRLPLRAGSNELVVFTEDLAERDTDWFFALEYLDAAPLVARLPFDAPATTVDAVRALAESVRPAAGLTVDAPFGLAFDAPAPVDVTLRVRIGNHVHERWTLVDRTLTLPAGATRLEVTEAGTVPDGMFQVSIDFAVGDARVERHIEAAFLASLTPRPPVADLAAAKAEASRFFARNGQPLIGRVLAMLKSGDVDADMLRRIVTRTLDYIDHREDCADFWIVPLIWICADYAEALPADLAAAARASILGFRYWVDEPGNDAMWFWSENHVLCFHVAQHIAGRLYPDARFTCSGRLGAEQARLGAERLGRWFDSIEVEGLAEWNSSAYYPIDFLGLLGLHHLGEASLATRASGLLDRICQMVALHTMAGVPGGSQGRAYNKELLGGPLTELVSIVRIAFGTGWLNRGVTAPPLLAASEYRPPASALAFADPGEGQSLEARYTQGLDHTARLVVYRSRHAQLSSVVDHATGRHGHQQHVVDVQLSGHPLARLWVNHPGEEDPSGSHRPSFWAGNGVLPRVGQLLDVSMLVFDLGDDRIGWTHAYYGRDGMDEVRRVGDWLLVRSGLGAAALYAAAGLDLVTTGPTAGCEVRSPGRHNGWIVAVGQDFEALAARLATATVTFDAAARRLALDLPDRPVLALDYQAGLSLGGEAMPFRHFSPVPTLTFHSARPQISPLHPFLASGK